MKKSKWVGQNQTTKLTQLQRFMQKIIVLPNECWEWQGGRNKQGYGQFQFNGKVTKASRASYQLFIGEIPDGKFDICHTCDWPPCCNPVHLFLGTRKDNMLDAQAKGRKPTATCPSITMYDKGCRCEGCVEVYREQKRESAKLWRKNNPEKVKEINKKEGIRRSNSLEYKEKRSEYNKIKYNNNRQENLKKQAEWRKNHPETMQAFNEKRRLDRLANPEKYKEIDKRAWERKKLKKLGLL